MVTSSSSLVCSEVSCAFVLYLPLSDSMDQPTGKDFSWCGVPEYAVILGLVLPGNKCESA